MGVVSSEEIAAALEVAIEACEERSADLAAHVRIGSGWGDEYKAGRLALAAPLDNAAKTLRAHLSRLREEAEFRDAALAYVAWCETSNREIAEIDTGKTFAWINRLGELQHALRLAYRALEEPRDG